MPHTSNRTSQLREAAAHACSVHAQSQITTPATTPAASTWGDSVTSSLQNTPETGERASPVSTIHSTVGDEESSVDINEHDQETSPASGSEADIQRSDTDHHDQMIEDKEDTSELEGEELLQSLKAWIEAETEDHGEEDNEESSAYDVLMRGVFKKLWQDSSIIDYVILFK